MRFRVAALACAAALLSCGPQGPGTSTANGPVPRTPFDPTLVRVNGFAIDVKGKAPAVPPGLEAQAPGRAKAAKRTKWIVQFAGPIREEDRASLAALVTAIGDYLPEFAFVVSMDEAARARVEKLPSVRGVARFHPAYKIALSLKDEAGGVRVEPAGNERVRVRVDAADGLPALLSGVHAGKGKVLGVGKDVAHVQVARADIARLAALEEVLWIEPFVQMELVNDTSRWTIQSFVRGSTPMSDRGLDGSGQLVGIGDSGVDADMCYFADPAAAPYGPTHRKIAGYVTTWGDDWDGIGHGTHVSGTVAGDQQPLTGVTTADGMAPKARIFMSDLTPGATNYVFPPDDLGLMLQAPYDAGARIHTNSWGAPINVYDMSAWSADRFTWEHPDLLVLFANGNSGPYDLMVGTPATAKNVVSVGATVNGELADRLASFSSHGPAWDGRVKPTLTAPGVAVVSAASDGLKDTHNCGTVAYSGTSMATPTVAGAAALVRQYYVQGFYPSGLANPADAFTPSAALVKATLVNTAQAMVGDFSGGPIPSNGQGWGRINLSNALRFAGDSKYLDVSDVRAGLATGATWTRQFYALGGSPLKATLVWTDYPGMQQAVKELVNDLDLEVVAPDGTTYLGNVFSQGASLAGGAADRLNVEEQVYLPASVQGTYTVRVKAYNIPVGPQPFALVVTGAGGIGPKGFIGLDRTRYGSATTIQVKVGDRDLNANPAVAEEAWVTVRSGTEPAGERVRLVEAGPDASVFLGTLPTGPAPGVPGDGILAVRDGDVITAVYEDANDGTGAPATVTASAVGDLVPPAIAGVTVTALGQGGATITWTTSEPATASVLYGKTGALGATVSNGWLDTSHSVVVGGLEEGTTYLFAVESADEAGNVARDDAGGALRTFTTLVLPPDIAAHSSVGDTTRETQTVVFGTALDPSGVASLTVGGVAVPVRSADGYFERTVPLAVGPNPIEIVATDGRGLVARTVLTVTREPLPDLTVTWVTAPESWGLGVPFEGAAEICNVGPGDQKSEYITVTWFLYEDDVPGVAPLVYLLRKDRLYTMLNAGACTPFRHLVVASSPEFLGRRFHVGAYVEIAEPEGDAAPNDNITTTLLELQPPDLVVTALSAPARVGTAVSFDATVTISDVGVGAVAPYPLVSLYLSTDDVITTADRLVTTYGPVLLHDPGQSVTATVPVVLPSDLPAGSYRLGAIVDAANQIREGNETNNALAGPLVTVDGPDLQATSVSAPASALTGATVTVHDVVTASATGGGASAFTVGIYASPDPTVTTADVRLARRTVAGLAPGASSAADTTVEIPRTWAGGAWWIGAIVDDQNAILETNEANNVAASPIQIVGPDLAVTSLVAPASAFAGGTIVVDDTVVASAAGGFAPATAVAFYLSPDPVITTADSIVGWRDIPALAPGGASVGSTTLALPVNLAPGTWYVGAIVDDFTYCWQDVWETTYCVGGDVAKEPDASNNVRASGPVAVAGTDLVLSALSGPASGATGMPLVVHDTATAIGGGAGPFQVAYYLSADATITSTDTLLGTRTVGGLAPGGSSTADTSLTVPATLAPGTWYLGAIVDSGNAIREADETNNSRAGGTVAIAGCDLAVTSVTSPATAAAGVPFEVAATVSNLGAGASPATLLVARLSPDATITPADPILAWANVPGIAPGGSAQVRLSVAIASSFAPGSWWVGASVDPNDQVREAVETNNSLAGGPLTLASPDLAVTALAGPSAARTGDAIALSYTVAAAATGAVAGASSLAFYLSPVAPGTDVYLGAVQVPSMASGTSASGTATWGVPTTMPGGAYRLVAVADAGHVVAESNEANNSLAGNEIAIAGPDIVATAVSGPAAAVRGSAITVVNTVAASASGGATPGFYVGVFLSADANITSADVLLGYRWVAGLAPGASSSDATVVTVPATLAPGTWWIGVIADNFPAACEIDWSIDAVVCVENQAKEPDEANNALAGGTIAITAP